MCPNNKLELESSHLPDSCQSEWMAVSPLKFLCRIPNTQRDGIFEGVIRIDVRKVRLSDAGVRQPARSLQPRAWRRAHMSKWTWKLPEAKRRGLGRKLILLAGTFNCTHTKSGQSVVNEHLISVCAEQKTSAPVHLILTTTSLPICEK